MVRQRYIKSAFLGSWVFLTLGHKGIAFELGPIKDGKGEEDGRIEKRRTS